MALLPNQEVKVLDETRGIQAVQAPDSINIASFIKSDTGPLGITKLSNKQQLIDLYCTGNSISPTDDITIQYNAALLDTVPISVSRIDTSKMKIGLGCTGTKMYFDKSYKLIDKITKANIKDAPTVLTSLWVTLDVNGTSNLYYLGTEPDVDKEVTPIRLGTVDTPVTISNFFELLNLAGVLYSYDETSARFIYEILDITSDLHNQSTEDYSGAINVITNNANSTITEANYMLVNNYAFYNANFSTSAVDTFSNPIPIRYIADEVAMPTDIFLLKVMEYIYESNLIKDPWGQSVRVSVSVPGATFSISESLSDYIKVEDNSLVCLNGYKLLSGGHVSVTVDENTYVYSFGTDYTGISLTGSTCSAQGFLELVHEQLVISEINNTIDITNCDDTSEAIYLYNSVSAPNITIYAPNIIYTVESDDSFVELTHATDKTNNDYSNNDSQWVLIDSTCFYGGNKPAVDGASTYVQVTKLSLSSLEFLDELYPVVNNIFTLSRDPKYGVVLSGAHDISASSNISVTNVLKVNQRNYTDEFAIVLKFPCSQPLLSFKYVYNNDEYNTIDLEYYYKDTINGSLTMSFDPNAMDGYGMLLYYTKYNEDPTYINPYIQIVKLTGTEHFTEYTSPKYGNELRISEPTTTDWSNAVNDYKNDKSTYYTFITDAGKCIPSFYAAIKSYADDKYTQYPPSFPVEYDTVDDILSYYESIDANSCEIQMLVPAHKSTYNGQFMTSLPASFTYILARISAFGTVVSENSPLFGTTNGVVTAPNLVKVFSDEDAQKLADRNINIITKDSTNTYIRSNFTGQKVNSYLSEDQNVYMANLIAHICAAYNPTIQSKLNTRGTREGVVTDISNNINARLLQNKNPTLAKFKVVCDDELNPQSVIEARQLVYQVWVQFTPSIAYVKTYEKVVRLNSF